MFPLFLFSLIRASRNPREGDGASFQMRLTYSPVAHFFLCLVQWTNCHLAGALGLLRILIYKVFPFLCTRIFCLIYLLFSLRVISSCFFGLMGDWCRLIRMGKPLCPFTKGKQALDNFMVRFWKGKLNPCLNNFCW